MKPFFGADFAIAALRVNAYQNLYFSLNDVRKKLDVLGRLQVVLEILLLAESQIRFSVECLQSLAAFSLNNIEAQVTENCIALKYEVLLTHMSPITVFYVMTLCSLMGEYQHLVGTLVPYHTAWYHNHNVDLALLSFRNGIGVSVFGCQHDHREE
jgi:hypothetical protein